MKWQSKLPCHHTRWITRNAARSDASSCRLFREKRLDELAAAKNLMQLYEGTKFQRSYPDTFDRHSANIPYTCYLSLSLYFPQERFDKRWIHFRKSDFGGLGNPTDVTFVCFTVKSVCLLPHYFTHDRYKCLYVGENTPVRWSYRYFRKRDTIWRKCERVSSAFLLRFRPTTDQWTTQWHP